MKSTIRFFGVVLGLAALSTVAAAQQHDMSKMGKDSAKKEAMPGMKHDAAAMKEMMGDSTKMKSMMKSMKPSEMKSGWKELDDMHAMLQATWHGAMDNDLRAAKAMSADVAKAAVAWEKSKGPAKCDNAEARKALPGIVADAKAYDAMAKTGKDADVKAALKKVHDGFEKVAMPCMMGEMKDMKH